MPVKYKFTPFFSAICSIALLVLILSPACSYANKAKFPFVTKTPIHTKNIQANVKYGVSQIANMPLCANLAYLKSSTIFYKPGAAFHSENSGSPSVEKNNALNIDSILKKVELIPVMITGNKNNRINIIIMNRWTSREKEPYNNPGMKAVFLQDINESLIAAFTPGDPKAQTAFANYHNFFNVYALWWPDMPEWDKGVDISIADSLRNRMFLPWKDENTGWVTILAMPNVRNGGGGAGRNLEERIGDAVIAGNGIGKMLHEISHTCMSLGDEYTGAEKGTVQPPTYNATVEYRRDKIKWRKWIDANTPLPTPYTKEYANKVGAFEGNQYHLANYFRSSAQGCIMGAGVFDNTERMCAVCEQRVAMRVYSLVNPINNFFPSGNEMIINGDKACHFSIDHIRPEPNTQVVRWVLNGKTISTGTDSITIKLGALSDYELVCSLTDETAFIRPDPPFGQYPVREIRWNIHNLKPAAVAKDLTIDLQSFNISGMKAADNYEIRSVVSGGKPPFSYQWSTGDTTPNIKNVSYGIYKLLVTDRDFRQGKYSYSLYEGKDKTKSFQNNSRAASPAAAILEVKENITASMKNADNGKISLEVRGGSLPYKYEWADHKYEYSKGIIYEAENALIDIPDHIIKNYFGAGNNAFVGFNGKEGSVSWKVDVARAGIYPVDIFYGGISLDNSKVTMSVNGTDKTPLVITFTRPLYKGWEKATFYANLNVGINWITLSSCGQSAPNIDYLSVPASYKELPNTGNERNNLDPGKYTVLITDSKNNRISKSFVVNEVDSFKMNKLELVKSGNASVTIKNPSPELTYEWYQNDAPDFYQEKLEKPLLTGKTFSPPAPGNFFVAVKNNQNNSESSNRMGIAIGKGITGNSVKEMNPESVKNDLLVWLDASDTDADGVSDNPAPERGPVSWKDKINSDKRKFLVKYQPNQLNGKGTGGFDNVWVQPPGKEVQGFQTIIIVYKESSMSFPGKSPFVGLSKYIGKSSDTNKRLFDSETTDEKTKAGVTYLNGKKVDPFATPNPMDFCILTVELGSKASDAIRQTEGYWEGSLAELLVFNRALSETERKGIEEYLRKKWFSSVDLDF